MPPLVRHYQQHLLDTSDTVIIANEYIERELTEEVLLQFYGSLSIPRGVGLGWINTNKGTLATLVISSKSDALLIHFANTKNDDEVILAARQLLQTHILCNPAITLYGFDMGRLGLALYRDRGLRISNAIHIQDACKIRDCHKISNAVSFAVNGTDIEAYRKNIDDVFQNTTLDVPSSEASIRYVVLRAWLAGYMLYVGDMETRMNEVKPVDTLSMDEVQLRTLSQLDRGNHRLETQKAATANNEATFIRIDHKHPNKARVRSDRFQTRLRSRVNVRILLQDQYGHEYFTHGRIGDVSGQFAEVIVPSTTFTFRGKVILDITTLSHEDPTQADLKRDAHILRVLQNQHTLSHNPYLQLIWPGDPPSTPQWPASFTTSNNIIPLLMDPLRPMNNSQQTAVLHMLQLDNHHRITLIQGPPGTGKTTVVANFVRTASAAGYTGIWLVAQSNVAVKNIAEKLDAVGYWDWRLLVSSDFHHDWHEHLYRRISNKIIKSDEFKQPHRLTGVKVILCTLSMLSHPKISIFSSKIPITFLVVDEASQIKVSDYISPISNNTSLRKICFIGDDKQLPPYGQDDIEDIESIFERPHLRTTAVFLNTQYRMPPQIGKFISETVYEGQLRSNPKHSEANTPYTCFFVDVKSGREATHEKSYTNQQEAVTAVKMAATLQKANASFRIITPYDAQRSLIETMLRQAGLNYANKCFNVDSFQGNEDDIIILSLVRSHELGFLQDLRRTNVMLSRCKQYLFTCSSRSFLHGPAKDSLVGIMAEYFGEDVWIEEQDIDEEAWW